MGNSAALCRAHKIMGNAAAFTRGRKRSAARVNLTRAMSRLRDIRRAMARASTRGLWRRTGRSSIYERRGAFTPRASFPRLFVFLQARRGFAPRRVRRGIYALRRPRRRGTGGAESCFEELYAFVMSVPVGFRLFRWAWPSSASCGSSRFCSPVYAASAAIALPACAPRQYSAARASSFN